MNDHDLLKLIERPPDHALDTLEQEIWLRVAERQQSLRVARRLLALQSVVLAAALVGSFLAGQHYSHRGSSEPSLEVFSPYMPLSVSTLLVRNRP